jgi:hypothetical protein
MTYLALVKEDPSQIYSILDSTMNDVLIAVAASKE